MATLDSRKRLRDPLLASPSPSFVLRQLQVTPAIPTQLAHVSPTATPSRNYRRLSFESHHASSSPKSLNPIFKTVQVSPLDRQQKRLRNISHFNFPVKREMKAQKNSLAKIPDPVLAIICSFTSLNLHLDVLPMVCWRFRDILSQNRESWPRVIDLVPLLHKDKGDVRQALTNLSKYALQTVEFSITRSSEIDLLKSMSVSAFRLHLTAYDLYPYFTSLLHLPVTGLDVVRRILDPSDIGHLSQLPLQDLELRSCVFSDTKAAIDTFTLTTSSSSFTSSTSSSSSSSISSSTATPASRLGSLSQLSLKQLNLTRTNVTDNDLTFLDQDKPLNKVLQALRLRSCTQLSDKCMKIIGQLSELVELDLSDTNISEVGLAEIRGLTKLKKLDLSLCFKLRSVACLADLPLESLTLPSTLRVDPEMSSMFIRGVISWSFVTPA